MPQTTTQGSSRSLWESRWLLTLIRPLWQVSIIVLVMLNLPTNAEWSRASLVIGAVAVIADDILIATHVDDDRWSRIQANVLVFETIVGALLGCATILWFPQGPGSLLLVPTILSYGFLPRISETPEKAKEHMWGMWGPNLLTCVLVLLDALLLIERREWLSGKGSVVDPGWLLGKGSVVDPGLAAINVYLLIGLYATVACFAMIALWAVRRFRSERQELQRLIGTLELQSEQLTRVNEQVNTYANRVYDLATAEERNRIAGEIHDTVAHRLTALLVQLQAARRMVELGDISAARDNFTVSEELARESLEEVRQSVRSIRRHEGHEGIDALQKLALQYASLTGMTVQFQAHSDVQSVPVQLMAMLYRIIQEGLTNAQRHGRATRVDIVIMRKGPLLVLQLKDNGKGAANPTLGFGLSSMRTRLLRYGGEISVASQPGSGFQLQLTLPLWEEWSHD